MRNGNHGYEKNEVVIKMPSDDRFTIQVEGLDQDGGDVRLDYLIDKLNSILEALEVSAKILVDYDNRNRVVYRVVDISRNSPVSLTVEAFPSDNVAVSSATPVINFFFDHLEKLREGKVQNVNPEFVRAINKVSQNSDDRFSHISIERRGTRININKDMWYENKLVEIQSTSRETSSWGTIKGRVERYNNHGESNYFWLYTVIGGSIKCEFADSLKYESAKAVERNISVSGLMTYKPEQPIPYKCKVEKIQYHEPNEQLPELRIGQFPEISDEQSPSEYIRGIRDDW